MSIAEHYDPETGEITPATVPSIPGAIGELSVVSAEINQQIATARHYPRRKDKVIAQEIVERATLNAEIARECHYKLKRSSRTSDEATDIIGPSIRFAEIARASYGNIRVASRFVGIDERVKGRAMVVVEAVAMDMQTNDAVLLSVSRSIMTSPKNGPPHMFTPDMVNVTMMAAQSIAQRDATLRLIPKALWIDGYQAAIDATRGTIATLAERRRKMLDAFAKYGIKPDELFKAIGVESEAEIGLDHMVDLAGMWTAMKEGENPDTVLGRANAANRPAPEPVTNPLAEARPTSGSNTSGQAATATATAQDQATPSTSTVAEKAQAAQAAPQAAADASSPQAAVQQPAPQENAPAATAPAAAPASKGEGYVSDALVVIANAVSATKLREWWKKARPGREMAELTEAQHSRLLAAYESRLDQLIAS